MTDIYHITDVQNLPSIIEVGGLCCDTTIRQHGIQHVSIAHANIKARRAATLVQRKLPRPRVVAAGGTLADYVPFYFAPRSPMLYTINRGNVDGYPNGQNGVIHLVSSAEAIQDAGLIFAFTDGHGIMYLSEFYDDLADLDRVDWAVMALRYWHDTNDDNDRKRRREAEFLVHRFLPWSLIREIGVINDQMEADVRFAMTQAAHQPIVTIQCGWYY